MLGFDRYQDYCSCRPRSKSIEHKFRIRGIYHALGRCSRHLTCTRLLAKFRMEFKFTDEKVSAEFARELAKGSRSRSPARWRLKDAAN
jgi:hypothetical protein